MLLFNRSYRQFLNPMMSRNLLFFCVLVLNFSVALSQYDVDWKFKTEGKIFGTALVDGDLIYVGSGDHKMYALEKETGKKVWEFMTEGAVHSSPMLLDNVIVFGSRDGNLYAVNKNNGTKIWQFDSKGEKINGPWDYYLSSPKTDGKLVYWGSGDGHLYALDPSNGSLKWKFESKGIIHADPVISGDKVFIGSFDGHLYALNKLNGELIWKFDTLGAEYFPLGEIQKAVLVDKGTVYFGSRDYNIYALNENTGAVKWNMREPAGWIIATPMVLGDQIFFGTSDAHKFYSLNKNYGGPIWEMPLRMRVFGSGVAYNDQIIFGTFDGKIVATDVKTGDQKWEFQTQGSKKNYSTVFNEKGEYVEGFSLYGKDMMETERKIIDLGSVLGTPVISGKSLYFGSSDGYLYALGLTD